MWSGGVEMASVGGEIPASIQCTSGGRGIMISIPYLVLPIMVPIPYVLLPMPSCRTS